MFKKTAAYLILQAAKRQDALPLDVSERRQPDHPDPLYNDSFYFGGRHENGTTLITRLSFRGSGETECWLTLKLPDEEVLTLPVGDYQRGAGIVGGSLAYECLIPGQKWAIRYDGPLIQAGSPVEVSLALEFTESMKPFYFKGDGHTWTMAKALAAERWSREWFQQLRGLQQEHYEQGGRLTGSVTIANRQILLDLPSMRGRSFGYRNRAKTIHHLWLFGCMDDGSFLNVSLASYTFLSLIKAGFLATSHGSFPLVDCSSLETDSTHDSNPRDFRLSLQFKNQESIMVHAHIEESFYFLMEEFYQMRERAVTLHMGDVRGVGIADFGINLGEEIILR